MRHMGRPPMTREESEEALARYRRHWDEHGFGTWAVELRETGELSAGPDSPITAPGRTTRSSAG